jgi:hypothetical protein
MFTDKQEYDISNNSEIDDSNDDDSNETTNLTDNDDYEILNNNDKFFRKSYNFVEYIGCISYKSIKIVFNVSSIYILWIFLHYIASHSYVKFCTPDTIKGFIISPFLTSSPHCNGLRWVINSGSNVINNMWLLLGTWIGSCFIVFKPFNPHDKRY